MFKDNKKESMAKKMKADGFDSNKRMGNSAIKGVGVNSPAMMEARKKFKK
jgi:hypothetical protein